jgi:hypothetical protein
MKISRTAVPVVLGSLCLALAGCAPSSSSPNSAPSNPKVVVQLAPKVANCAVLQVGSPSRFACDDKVYTSYQLAKLREDEAKKYVAGQ